MAGREDPNKRFEKIWEDEDGPGLGPDSQPVEEPVVVPPPAALPPSAPMQSVMRPVAPPSAPDLSDVVRDVNREVREVGSPRRRMWRYIPPRHQHPDPDSFLKRTILEGGASWGPLLLVAGVILGGWEHCKERIGHKFAQRVIENVEKEGVSTFLDELRDVVTLLTHALRLRDIQLFDTVKIKPEVSLVENSLKAELRGQYIDFETRHISYGVVENDSDSISEGLLSVVNGEVIMFKHNKRNGLFFNDTEVWISPRALVSGQPLPIRISIVRGSDSQITDFDIAAYSHRQPDKPYYSIHSRLVNVNLSESPRLREEIKAALTEFFKLLNEFKRRKSAYDEREK